MASTARPGGCICSCGSADWAKRVEQKIRAAIENSDLSENEFATLSGIALTTFRRRVAGVNPWTTSEIAAVARVLDTDPQSLVTVPAEDAA